MKWLSFLLMLCFFSCQAQTDKKNMISNTHSNAQKTASHYQFFDSDTKTIHVFVALCDNQYQGIVPVPAALGNGQYPNTNLYWGAAYGVKTYFRKSDEWQLIETRTMDSVILERLVFKHKKSNYYVVADAYNGQFIKQATANFLYSTHGQQKDTLRLKNKILGIGGNAALNAYIGHDGLMDFEIEEQFQNTDNKTRDFIILACYSRYYFTPHIDKSTTHPVVWTSGLMAPEAYILHDALRAYIANEPSESIQLSAAQAYAKYQKCGLNAAKKLLVRGW